MLRHIQNYIQNIFFYSLIPLGLSTREESVNKRMGEDKGMMESFLTISIMPSEGDANVWVSLPGTREEHFEVTNSRTICSMDR